MQTVNGKPVLTFWQGALAKPPAYTNVPAGSSEVGSCYYILDETYAVIKTVQWLVLGGSKPKKLFPIKFAAKAGFETAIPVRKKGPYFQIKALDTKGRVIGESKIVKFL